MDEVVEVVDDAGMQGLRAWLEGFLQSAGGGGRAFLLTHREVVCGRVIECRKGREEATEYVLREWIRAYLEDGFVRIRNPPAISIRHCGRPNQADWLSSTFDFRAMRTRRIVSKLYSSYPRC